MTPPVKGIWQLWSDQRCSAAPAEPMPLGFAEGWGYRGEQVMKAIFELKKLKAELKAMVIVRGSTLLEIHGIGPAGGARILADVGDITRFADR